MIFENRNKENAKIRLIIDDRSSKTLSKDDERALVMLLEILASAIDNGAVAEYIVKAQIAVLNSERVQGFSVFNFGLN